MYKPNPQPPLPHPILFQVPYLSEWHHHPNTYASQTPEGSLDTALCPCTPLHGDLSPSPIKFTSQTHVLLSTRSPALVQAATTSHSPAPPAAAVTFQKADLIRSPPSSQNPSALPRVKPPCSCFPSRCRVCPLSPSFTWRTPLHSSHRSAQSRRASGCVPDPR